ncbi:hypothetical protein RRG08_052908 [Elysia crispata]|uniref:Uncharacterized protein n=1 Tax=Elysia crispata TaxID=231223 RepID=A0AAE0ZEE5_9GAST|nr:hypothetical protein RRG08_052908 [Elysia crispata]
MRQVMTPTSPTMKADATHFQQREVSTSCLRSRFTGFGPRRAFQAGVGWVEGEDFVEKRGVAMFPDSLTRFDDFCQYVGSVTRFHDFNQYPDSMTRFHDFCQYPGSVTWFDDPSQYPDSVTRFDDSCQNPSWKLGFMISVSFSRSQFTIPPLALVESPLLVGACCNNWASRLSLRDQP